MKIGLIGNSEFANRIMIPAIEESEEFEIGMIGSSRPSTNTKYKFGSYKDVLNSDVEAVYISVINSMHKEWIIKSLEAGKHVFCEKPICLNYEETLEVVKKARETGLALYENYMFVHHDQHAFIKSKLDEIGDIRFFKAKFTIPDLPDSNYRNHKDLGGGAVLDLAGYTIKAAQLYFGDDIKITGKQIKYQGDLDLYGQATLESDTGVFMSIYFGIGELYSNIYEIHGSKGILRTTRAYSPKKDEVVKVELVTKNMVSEFYEIPKNDQYLKSLKHFYNVIHNNNIKESEQKSILKHFAIKQTLINV